MKHLMFEFRKREYPFTVGKLLVKRVSTVRDKKTRKVKEFLFYDKDDVVIAHYWVCFFGKIVFGWEEPNGDK